MPEEKVVEIFMNMVLWEVMERHLDQSGQKLNLATWVLWKVVISARRHHILQLHHSQAPQVSRLNLPSLAIRITASQTTTLGQARKEVI